MKRFCPPVLALVVPAVLLALLLGAPSPVPPAAAQEAAASAESSEGDSVETPAPVLGLEAIEVAAAGEADEATRLGPDTLCRLSVRVSNRGEETVSYLGFAVEVEGTPLVVYRNQLFVQALPPGETTTVDLYNFWTSESGRPAPTDGALTVTVRLEEARRVAIATDEAGAEVWTPGDAVAGLPVAATVERPFGEAPRPAEGGGS